jgi:hypothetical protein
LRLSILHFRGRRPQEPVEVRRIARPRRLDAGSGKATAGITQGHDHDDDVVGLAGDGTKFGMSWMGDAR